MHRTSTRSGRISFVVLAGILSIAMVAALFLFNGQSPKTTAAEFMSALAKGDADKLADLSYIQGKSREQIKKEWQDTIKWSKAYLFRWDISTVTQRGDDSAAVRVEIWSNPLSPQSYSEPKPLTLIKENGAWKVDVTQITRDAFPYLPQ